MIRLGEFGTSIFGIKIIEVPEMVEVIGEDWSKVRSHPRARRRRKKHRQNIRPLYAPMKNFIRTPDGTFCHPAMAAKLFKAIAKGGDE